MKKQEHHESRLVRVERATHADIDPMSALLAQLFTIEVDFEPDRERQIAGLKLLLGREDAAVLVARSAKDEVVGLVAAQLVVSTAEGALSVWIEDVVVDAAMRGHGAGRALLEAALEWAREAGATRAMLLIDTDNTPAEAFYARLGWQKTQLAARRLSLRRAPGP